MKKSLFFLTSLIFLSLFYYSTDIHAFPHGYERKTENIHAIIRHDVQALEYPGEEAESIPLPLFTPIEVISMGDVWCEIEYTTDKESGTAWISKDDFYWGCLRYDGRPKQPVADGTYRLININRLYGDSFLTIKNELLCDFSFLENGNYTIKMTDKDRYLASASAAGKKKQARWRSENGAGEFTLIRKGAGYLIHDNVSKTYLCEKSGILLFSRKNPTVWRFSRKEKAVTDESLRDFVQFDGDWANHYYGDQKGLRTSDTDNFCTAGCGIFATINAIHSANGQFADPIELADYAVEKYFRIPGSGTDSGFFEACAREFGFKYGFKYMGTGESLDELKRRLQKGQTAITYVPGHYVTIVDYDSKKDRFLLLDPHYLPKRETCSFGDWVSRKTLEEGNLFAQTFYYYGSMDHALTKSGYQM